MVRHGWRGAFWSRLTDVGARRREAPHAQPAHCPTAPAITLFGGRGLAGPGEVGNVFGSPQGADGQDRLNRFDRT